ncbi:MAG: efflux RND transporter permease subunit, partial [Bilophila sp.]
MTSNTEPTTSTQAEIKEGFFLRRPIFSTVISLIITLVGALAITVLPIEQYPDLTPPQVEVSATYTGASAEVVAETVASLLESQINGVENMIYMNSVSSGTGSMTLTVSFDVGTDPDQATIDVNNRVQLALAQLPQEVQRMGVSVLKKSPAILQIVFLTSPDGRYDTIYLSNYALLNIVDELKRLPGVGDAKNFAAQDYAMRIWLQPDRMKQLKITTDDVASALRDQNAQFAAGRVGEEPMSHGVGVTWQVTAMGRLTTPEQFGEVILRTATDGSILRLKDVARIEVGAQSYGFVGKFNGIAAVPIGVYLSPGANALATAEAVKAKMQELASAFPVGVAYDIPYDTTTFVRISIEEVVKTLFEAMVLVFLVVFLFLQNWRATLIPCLAVPVSIVGTFAGMYALGFSINTLTMFGLVLAIGIVV